MGGKDASRYGVGRIDAGWLLSAHCRAVPGIAYGAARRSGDTYDRAHVDVDSYNGSTHRDGGPAYCDGRSANRDGWPTNRDDCPTHCDAGSADGDADPPDGNARPSDGDPSTADGNARPSDSDSSAADGWSASRGGGDRDRVWRCPGGPEGARYVGSKESDKYHYTGCRWAEKILDVNRLCFLDEASAVAYGYVACSTCKP